MVWLPLVCSVVSSVSTQQPCEGGGERVCSRCSASSDCSPGLAPIGWLPLTATHCPTVGAVWALGLSAGRPGDLGSRAAVWPRHSGGGGEGGWGITDTILSTYYPPPLLHNHQPSSHSHGLSYKFPLFIFPPTLPSPPPSPPCTFPSSSKLLGSNSTWSIQIVSVLFSRGKSQWPFSLQLHSFHLLDFRASTVSRENKRK